MLCSFQSDSLSHFTLQKLATAAENFQKEYQWKDEFEVTATQKYSNTHKHLQKNLQKPLYLIHPHCMCVLRYTVCG